jgi:AcrR family transcriptional regulator
LNYSLYTGFEVVTIKDIAHKIGRNQASIYNHFESKQDILDNIYDYFCKQFLLDRPTVDDLEPVLANGSLYDIIDAVFYTFQSEHVDRLINITKIIHTRKFTDERAKQIALEIIVQSGIDFAKAVFDRAIEIQRIKPCDTHTLSLFCNYIRQGLYNRLILDPREENHTQLLKEEKILKKCAASVLTDLHEETKT